MILKIANKEASIDYYINIHQDSSINTVNEYLDNALSFVKYLGGKPKEFLQYKGEGGKTNLQSIWNRYTEKQKITFGDTYELLSREDKNNYVPVYDDDIGGDYEINTGTDLYIPKNKANVEVFAATGKGVFLKQQKIKTFLSDEFRAITNDPTYIKIENVNIDNEKFSINYMQLNCSVWVYIRSLDTIYNITPFILNLSTTMSNVGDFSITLNDISDIDVNKYGNTYYDYFQKIKDGKYNLSFWQKYIQQNDIVWIRFEALSIEKRNKENIGLIVPKKEIPGKIYDMIGLVDNNQESYQASSNISTISIKGRDLSKMFQEDGSYFYPFAMMNGGEDFYLNYNKKDTVFKRLFNQGEFLTLFTASLRSIRDSLGFIFNQLTNVGILPIDSDLFNAYEHSINPLTKDNTDRTAKIYEFASNGSKQLKLNDVNGIWKIIHLLVDEQLDSRRVNNGEISAPDGTIYELIMKVCDSNFVEIWSDTCGDLFNLFVRQPPFTLSAIQDYFDNNLIINISANDISSINLGWDNEFYTWYQITPYKGLYGGTDFISAAYMPIVYLEEYSQIFGIHKKVINDNYINYDAIKGSNKGENIDLFRKMVVEDLIFTIGSNSIKPFTRRGSIQLRVGDRRIKRGNWIYLEPTNEICYVTGVSQNLSANGNTLDRYTDIIVEKCMVKDFILNGGKEVSGIIGKVNYFNIVNLDAISNNLQINLIDNKVETGKLGNINLVNKEIFYFFVNRQQFTAKQISSTLKRI